jgi:lipopolysaccharide transport system ATP-binding protein
MSDVAFKVERLTKIYRLYDDPVDRLKESLHPFRKKYHRDFFALNDVSFEIKTGETVGIIGKNGAGKSTLLKILTGVLNPTHGQVSVNGRVLSLLELGTGFNPELTGIENIYFNGALLGASREEMERQLHAILEFADIGDFVHQPVKTYSSGMYVRLAFAVIANMDADVLIVDEALAVGDAFFVQKCMRFLRNFIENGTLVFVSHDSGAVLNLCSRAIWLHEGVLQADGVPKKIVEAYLANLYEAQQRKSRSSSNAEDGIDYNPEEYHDMRMDIIRSSPFRNDIKLFKFDINAESYGKGGASITSVCFEDKQQRPLTWVVGGEMVSLVIRSQVQEDFFSPIVGFIVKDRLGQSIFADNTYLTYADKAVSVQAGHTLEARFLFRMPVMQVGDYSICVALAEGTQQEHVQHHWYHDALIFKVHSSHVCHGLIGAPMKKIELRII